MESITKKVLEAKEISCGISRFKDAASLLSSIETGEKFDILLLDVMMENLNGMELAAALRGQGNDVAIIFVSANREMALLGYEVSAVRYLAKPIQREKLQETLLYCCQRRLIMTSGECKTSAKISELERLLPKERFVFCHRTLLVSLAFVQSIRYCELTLKNGQTLPVSKYRQSQIRESLFNYLRG